MSSTPVSDPGLPNTAPTECYWQTPPHHLASHQSPCLPNAASIVIIGSGITGTSVAHHLLQESSDLDIVMLEARTITSGATGRNGGHCKDVPFKTYRKWKADFGIEAAGRLVRFKASHIDSTRQLASQLREEGFADAKWRDVESVTAVYDPHIFRELKSNMEAWLEDFPEEHSKFTAMSVANGEEKYGIVGACGFLAFPAAALWPYRLVTGLLDRLLRKHKGFSLEALTPVKSITVTQDPSKPYAVNTPRGQIRARHVVHCTNGYASHLLPALRGKIIPVRGQMTALTTPRSFPRLGHRRSWSMYWPNGGFDYMSQAGDQEGHVFLGGGVEQGSEAGIVDFDRASDGQVNPPALAHLRNVLPRYFQHGADTELKQAWTGVMGFTGDEFPVVGRIPSELSPRNVVHGAAGSEWIAAGFNGYGMVHCWHSGRAIADMILERPSEAIEAYFPKEQFECSQTRMEKMDLDSMKSRFYRNAPIADVKSRL